MKIQKILCLSGALLLSNTLFATEISDEKSDSRAHIKAEHHKEGNLYVVAKGLISSGDTLTEEKEAKLESLKGDRGAGLGVDVGYRLGYGFAAELDLAYTHTTVTKSVKGEEDLRAGADYYSVGVDLLYGYHFNEQYVLFGKIGWEIEKEKITDYGIDGTNNGFCYAVGLEYALTENWALLAEYEVSLIEGPRGNSLFAGVSYTF